MKSRTLPALVLFLLLGCLALLVAGLVLMRARMAQAAEQPLVLINSPASGERLWMDRAVPVLVTARSRNSIARLELWVNGHLRENRAVPQDDLTTFTTAFVWQPNQPGSYTLIARAFDDRGNAGQATVAVTVVASLPPDEPPIPPPASGETSPGNNDDPGSGGTPPPVGETEPSPPGTAEAPPAGEAPPPDETPPAPAPGGPADELVAVGGTEPAQVTLTLDALGLDSGGDYHAINCYFTVADAETAQVVFGIGVSAFPWEPAQPISATFPWPADQPLPVRVECTAVSPPAEAIPLGSPVEGEIAPESWDGSVLELESPGAYTFFYRVQFGGGASGAEIPAPTNLRIEDVPLSPLKMLRWDWAGDAAQIEGFRLYLNGSLQWRVADPSARFTYLPPEWLDPSCGQLYHFQVVAYSGPFPAGAESPPGEMAPLEPAAGRCGAVYRVTFETVDMLPLDYPTALPGVADGDGAIGPLYGWFWVNDSLLPFDTVQSDGISVAGVRVVGGEHLNVPTVLYDESYRYHRSSVVFQWDNDWPVLSLGGSLVDYDWGETDSADDLVCAGGTWGVGPPPAPFAGTFNCVTVAPADVAHVTYRIEELPEWPEGEPPPGAIPGAPRPDLQVWRWELGPGGDLVVIVSNDGQASAVPDVGLALELDGAPLDNYTIPAGPNPLTGEWDGWMSLFTLPGRTFASLADLCSLSVTVDPLNDYIEYIESNNTTTAADMDNVGLLNVVRLNTSSATLMMHVGYYSCHGDPIGVRAVPLLDGADVADFAVETGSISYGDSWPVALGVTYTGAAPLTTNGWRLEMVDLGASQVFLSVTLEDTQVWSP